MPEKQNKSIEGLLSVVEFERRYLPQTFEDKVAEYQYQTFKLEIELPKERPKEVLDCK
jgi:hypothetical protein